MTTHADCGFWGSVRESIHQAPLGGAYARDGADARRTSIGLHAALEKVRDCLAIPNLLGESAAFVFLTRPLLRPRGSWARGSGVRAPRGRFHRSLITVSFLNLFGFPAYLRDGT